ncbi:MAG: flagellar biosynthetic protein FliO [Hyphomicrobiaceae bacterium]|nr:flagellar biosynthetic protein FliO [Hyphomicrobiaceae bacterium]
MLQDLLGETGGYIAQFLLALIFVLALIFLVTWAIRRFGVASMMAGNKQKGPRLQVVEALALDNKRRLVLVRRDAMEHLVMIGGGDDVVIERSILNGISVDLRRLTLEAGRSAPAAEAPAPARPRPQESPAAAESMPAEDAPEAEAETSGGTLATGIAAAGTGIAAAGAGMAAASASVFGAQRSFEPEPVAPEPEASPAAGTGSEVPMDLDTELEDALSEAVEDLTPQEPAIIEDDPLEALADEPEPVAAVAVEATPEKPVRIRDNPLEALRRRTGFSRSPFGASRSEAAPEPETVAAPPQAANDGDLRTTDELLMESLDAALSDELDHLRDEDSDEDIGDSTSAPDGVAIGEAPATPALPELPDLDDLAETDEDEPEALSDNPLDALRVHSTPDVAPVADESVTDEPEESSADDLLRDLIDTPPLAQESPDPHPAEATPRPADPIAVRPPSRGPAAGASTINIEAATPRPASESPAPKRGDDPIADTLDDEMERLLSEIAGTSKKPPL